MSRPALRVRPSGLASTLAVLVLLPLLALPERLRRDRGDVPGWVLITVMTAGVVTAIWMFAQDALIEMFQTALAGVKGP